MAASSPRPFHHPIPYPKPNADVVQMDGTNLVGQVGLLTQKGAGIGFSWGVLHTIFYRPPSVGHFILDTGSKTALLAVMGAIFATTTSTIGKVTEQDGKINYFIGGCVAGTMLGARSNSFAVGAQGCAFFGGLAAFRKYYDEKGWEFK